MEPKQNKLDFDSKGFNNDHGRHFKDQKITRNQDYKLTEHIEPQDSKKARLLNCAAIRRIHALRKIINDSLESFNYRKDHGGFVLLDEFEMIREIEIHLEQNRLSMFLYRILRRLDFQGMTTKSFASVVKYIREIEEELLTDYQITLLPKY